jgi:hypothetical protein
MRLFDVRRWQQQSHRALFLMGIAQLCACTDGVGTPLVAKPAASDSGSGALASSVAGHTSSRIDAGVTDDDEPQLTSSCRHQDDTWRASYAADEKKLFEQVNQLRANPSSLCPPLFVPTAPLDWDPALQCSARPRAAADDPRKGPNAGPSFLNVDVRNSRSQEPGSVRDRSRQAETTIGAEFIAFNFSSADGIFEALRQDPEDAVNFCFLAAGAYLPALGIGKSGNVWVLDFGQTAFPSTTNQRPPTSGSGPGGPGISGTGGR